ncbi:hypothetical protein SSBR45G_19440 [Bradyrhizobium sp. SSBR45G]|uniref:hypothetical protein n=1 Tax=unclassified Bradyrhizobium TaxID=2631580 RepID=UPI002342A5BF|nr:MULTISPECIES: hypothetical protein [unclassified Bradyrhizobium]GLH77036.1 hypothetical protein SSBR45G_19440 [Bradyrhizobium sp. SSBR45G]GLH83794.1 hypothetical protein SSBR45R_12540 [Bradyrhizobium sp. SSBR45R]
MNRQDTIARPPVVHQDESLFFLLERLFRARDLQRGAAQIATFFHDKVDDRAIRATFHLLEKHRLPAAKLGSMWCARRSVISAWLWSQEIRVLDGEAEERLVRIHMLLTALIKLIPSDRSALAELSYDQAQFVGLLVETAATIRRVVHLDSL